MATGDNDLARHFALDPAVTFLNHGSFGACPRVVLDAQTALRERMEREPVQFFHRDYEPLLDEARAALGALLGARPEDLAFVPNASTAVNTVLRGIDLAAGDELIATDHSYGACRNAIEEVARRAGARVVLVNIPFPGTTADGVVEAVLARVTPRTRLAMLDHVTSPTALVFPLERLVPLLRERGVDTLVDGAHAPGMVPLDLDRLGAAYYTGNCHKWLCTPKGAAFLHVRRDLQGRLRPLVISHGATTPRSDRSRFLIEFDWTGTDDPTAHMAIPAAIRFLEGAMPGGIPGLRARNHALAVEARRILCDALGLAPPCPDELLGAIASVPLPDSPAGDPPARSRITPIDPIQDALFARHAIEVPVHPWPAPPRRLLRISAQMYNCTAHYERLAAALVELLGPAAGARP